MLRSEHRLGREADPRLAIVRELGLQRLHRDVAVEPIVVREVDDAHPTAAEDAEDAVAADERGEVGARMEGTRGHGTG